MDELTRKYLQAVDRFNASLTPEQLALCRVNALRIEQCTPYQQGLAEEITRTLPKGMTPAQAAEVTRQVTLEENRERFREGWERGWRYADEQAKKRVWIGLAIGCCIAILMLLARC